jgi:hypothetical protein
MSQNRSAEFLRGAKEELSNLLGFIQDHIDPYDARDDVRRACGNRIRQLDLLLAEAEAREASVPTAAEVIAAAERALECFPLDLIQAVTFDDNIPTRIKVSADSMRLLVDASAAITKWKEAQ